MVGEEEEDVEAARIATTTTHGMADDEGEEEDPARQARRLRRVVLRRGAAVLDRDLRERRRSYSNSSSSSSTEAAGDGPPIPPPAPPPPPPCFAHPLLGRFEEAGVEAVFAVYKANTLLGDRVTLCMTLALLALSIASIAVSSLFLERWGRHHHHHDGNGEAGGPGGKGGHSAFSDMGALALIVAVYGARAQRLIWPRPFTPEDVGFGVGVGGPKKPRWRRWWRAFLAQHYVALLLLPVPVEALLGEPLLMALNLATSCVFLLAASALLLAHAVAYCALAW